MINNVPADVLVSKDCNDVIAVSVVAKMGESFAGNQRVTPTEERFTGAFMPGRDALPTTAWPVTHPRQARQGFGQGCR